MKIMWITNFILPEVSAIIDVKTTVSGGWLVDLSQKISDYDNVELFIAAFYEGEKIREIKIDKRIHILIPGGKKRLQFKSRQTYKLWKKVIDRIKPDILHFHGTEYIHGIPLLNLYPNLPSVITIQGVMRRISKEYYGNLTFFDVLKNTTIKEFLTFNNHIIKKYIFKKRAKTEAYMLNRVKYVTGRTYWDQSIIKDINPNLDYTKLNYNLRKEFYNEEKWSLSRIEKYTIFCSASSYPLKGLDVLIKALIIIKKRFNNVKLYVPGGGEIKNNRFLKETGYQKMIRKLIKKYNLEKNVIFLGKLNAEQVARQLRKSNVFVVSSAIEGASASLCEAMYIGTPSVASFRGGITELLVEGKSGYYYDFPEYTVLANRIIDIFESDELAEKFSVNAIYDAEMRHNRERNTKEHIELYNKILLSEKKKLNNY